VTPASASEALQGFMFQFYRQGVHSADCDASPNKLISDFRRGDCEDSICMGLPISPPCDRLDPSGFPDRVEVEVVNLFYLVQVFHVLRLEGDRCPGYDDAVVPVNKV
jgi:hypothetical protein